MSESTPAGSQVEPLDIVARFNDAFDGQDLDAVLLLVTDDCVFEDTTPPDGGRHEGKAAVRQAWEQLFAGHVRGVDVFRVAGGLVAEKLSYVKG